MRGRHNMFSSSILFYHSSPPCSTFYFHVILHTIHPSFPRRTSTRVPIYSHSHHCFCYVTSSLRITCPNMHRLCFILCYDFRSRISWCTIALLHLLVQSKHQTILKTLYRSYFNGISDNIVVQVYSVSSMVERPVRSACDRGT
jgi:hypothetical protein